jgi:hypothetical protein
LGRFSSTLDENLDLVWLHEAQVEALSLNSSGNALISFFFASRQKAIAVY